MRAALSVIIPTLDAADRLPVCLDALVEGLRAGLIRELIVSDGGSGDATLRIADAAGAVIVQGAPSRGGQLRRAAGLAEGSWLLFVHADTVLPTGWASVVETHMQGDGAACFRLGFDVGGFAPRLVSGWANLRSRWFGLPYGDQALLVSKAVYEAAGGFEDIPLMEDVAMARALGGRIAVLPLSVTTSAARYAQDGWVRRGAKNLTLLIRYFLGADPQRLAAIYRRRNAGR